MESSERPDPLFLTIGSVLGLSTAMGVADVWFDLKDNALFKRLNHATGIVILVATIVALGRSAAYTCPPCSGEVAARDYAYLGLVVSAIVVGLTMMSAVFFDSDSEYMYNLQRTGGIVIMPLLIYLVTRKAFSRCKKCLD